MIVDFHTHVFSSAVLQRRAEFAERDRWFGHLNPEGSRRLASPRRLVAAMDEAGIDVAVALSFGWADQEICVEQNECVLEAAARFPRRVVPFCAVQPLAGAAAVAELERVARRGCRGVGELFPDGQGFSLDDRAVLAPVLEACAALDLLLLVHGSEPVGHEYPGKGRSTPDRLLGLARLARDVAPGLRLVYAHLGGGLPFYELMPEVEESLRNVWYDTGAASYLYRPEALTHAAGIVGSKLLFGSDFPVIRLPRMTAYAAQAALSEAQRTALMGDNAARLLGLP